MANSIYHAEQLIIIRHTHISIGSKLIGDAQPDKLKKLNSETQLILREPQVTMMGPCS